MDILSFSKVLFKGIVLEIKGEEFIKKVQIKQEKNDLEDKLHQLEEVENHINSSKEYDKPKSKTKNTEQKLNNLLLDQSATKSDKKKYLFLGLLLIILFLLTIISIRLLTNDDKNDDSFIDQKEEKIKQKIIDSENIEDEYQKIMEQTIKNIEKKKKIPNLEKTEGKLEKINTANIKKIQNKILKKKKEIPKKKKEIVKKTNNAKKSINKNIWPKKKTTKYEPKILNKNNTKTKNKIQKNIFVQIGAFSKIPNKKYLNNIIKLGFKYKIHKVYIKNKTFYKLLIGPYSSQNKASLESSKIKRKLNVSSAFILKL